VLRVREVSISNIAADIGYPERDPSFSVSPEGFWGNTGILKIGFDLSTLFPVPVTSSCDSTYAVEKILLYKL
jgi:hypothetical protein